MKVVFRAVAISLVGCIAGSSQAPTASKVEFDAAAINVSAPQSGHFRSPASSRGGPGTADPTLFRCTNCDLAFLVTKAFALQGYQLPGRASLPDTAYDVSARVAEGTTPEQFSEMMRNLLKERFGLTYHFETKQLQGYELIVAKNGPKLQESNSSRRPTGTETEGPRRDGAGNSWHGSGSDGGHDHAISGVMVFNGQARFRGDRKTTGELAQMISTQIARPVDDHTGLQGQYDIVLSWSDDGSHAASHVTGGGAVGDHGDHGGLMPGRAGVSPDDAAGPTLMAALQVQLGLKLEAKKVTAPVLIIDHVEKSPAAQ